MLSLFIKNILVNCILALLVLSGCSGIKSKKIISNYYLVSSDYDNQTTSLEYKIEKSNNYVGVVDQMVYEVGFNNKVIIVKQHPRKFPSVLNDSITNYYIVKIADKPTLSPEKGVIGPLTNSQFKIKLEKLGIPDSLNFTIHISKE